MVRTVLVVALAVGITAPTATVQAETRPGPNVFAQATTTEAAKAKGDGKVVDARVVTARGTVEAVDKEKKTVTLKGPKRSLTLEIRDPAKLEAIKVGDPVIAKYYEALVVRVVKPGEGTPGVSAQSARATSKPGETPAGVIGQEISATVTVVSVDKKANTVTVKGPAGNTEVVKARDPKNLEKLKAGDLIELTYTQALAISLDKPAKK